MTRGNMSPLNRGPLLGPRIPPAGIRPLPHPRFGAVFPPGMPHRMPIPPMNGILGPMRPRLPPPPRIGGVAQPGGPRPLLPPGRAPLPPMPGPRGPLMCPWPRRVLPPQMAPHMRPRFPPRNGTNKGKPANTVKKVVKFEAQFESDMEIEESNNELFDEIDENNKKRIKLDKQYNCEVCNRQYKTEEKLMEHVSMHKLCGIDGCTFSANNSLVDDHIKQQHRTGLYERLKNLSTPEEIQTWIENRKRKHPVKVRKEEEQKMDAEKIEPNEITRKVNKSIHSNVKKQKRKWRVPKEQNTLPVIETYRGLTQFMGTAFLEDDNISESESNNEDHLETKRINKINQNENTFDISDEEEDALIENNSMTNPIKNTIMCSLVADYESEEENGPEEVPIKKMANHSNETNVMEIALTDNKKSNTSEKFDKKKKEKEKVREREKKSLGIQNRILSTQKRYKNNHSINLLGKLLAKPIKRERNLIFQCIQYITNNNFFCT